MLWCLFGTSALFCGFCCFGLLCCGGLCYLFPGLFGVCLRPVAFVCCCDCFCELLFVLVVLFDYFVCWGVCFFISCYDFVLCCVRFVLFACVGV